MAKYEYDSHYVQIIPMCRKTVFLRVEDDCARGGLGVLVYHYVPYGN